MAKSISVASRSIYYLTRDRLDLLQAIQTACVSSWTDDRAIESVKTDKRRRAERPEVNPSRSHSSKLAAISRRLR